MANTSLETFVAEVNGRSHLRIEHDFGDGFVRLQTSEAERRQAAQDIQCTENIVLELLRNSRDAHACHIFVAMSKEGCKRTLTVIDDGDGVPPEMHERIFEPRVTSKLDTSHMDAWGLHGRGMALYSISVNAEEAAVASSARGLGSSIHVVTDVSKLPERTDQSSFPTFELSESGRVNVRGPRNILRTTCEFAIDSRDRCSVFIGSTSEVCAALYSFGMATLSTIDRLFCEDATALPLVKRLATATDPEALRSLAASLGLEISERTARRIMAGEIPDAEPVLERIAITPQSTGGKRPKARKGALDNRGLKLMPQDRDHLAQAALEGFAALAQDYFLEANVDPAIRVTRDRIIVSIPIVKRP